MQQITTEWTSELLAVNPHITLNGHCHDCGREVSVDIDETDKGFQVTGPYWVFDESHDIPFFKCNECFELDPNLTNFQPCEVFSRVVGYMRPVSMWNKGKQEEFKMRTNYRMEE
jgi:hypothetical protein